MKLTTGMRSPARRSRSRSPSSSTQATDSSISILKRPSVGDWKTNNPFAALSATEDPDDDPDISIVVGEGGEPLSGDGGFEVMVKHFVADRLGRLSPPGAGSIRDILNGCMAFTQKGWQTLRSKKGRSRPMRNCRMEYMRMSTVTPCDTGVLKTIKCDGPLWRHRPRPRK